MKPIRHPSPQGPTGIQYSQANECQEMEFIRSPRRSHTLWMETSITGGWMINLPAAEREFTGEVLWFYVFIYPIVI